MSSSADLKKKASDTRKDHKMHLLTDNMTIHEWKSKVF